MCGVVRPTMSSSRASRFSTTFVGPRVRKVLIAVNPDLTPIAHDARVGNLSWLVVEEAQLTVVRRRDLERRVKGHCVHLPEVPGDDLADPQQLGERWHRSQSADAGL